MTETIEPTNELVDHLAGIRGGVVTEADDGYRAASSVWNGMIDRRPAAIARCTSTADVIAALAHAREQQLPVSVRGGGHNVAGGAVNDGGVVIDLSALNNVRVDLARGTVRAGGGARLGDVDAETQAHGLAVPFGVVSRTGIAGLTLHGGLGFLTRRLGLSCDSLVGADVVTADGRFLQVDAERHPDLLWALRGGGAGFGVVTSLEYRVHPVGPEVFMVITLFPEEAAVEGMRVFGETMRDAPEELMAVAIFWSAPHEEPVPPEWHGKPVFVMAGCWSGPIGEAEEATRPLRTFAEPVVDMSGPMPYTIAQSLFDPEYPDGRRYYWKSQYLASVDGAAAEALLAHAQSRPSAISSIDVWALGGAMRREPDGGAAFPRRDESWLLGIEGNWDDPAADDANVGWVREVDADLARFGSGAGAYLNFPGLGEDGEELLRTSYGSSYERLREIKATYDPANLLGGPLTVAPK